MEHLPSAARLRRRHLLDVVRRGSHLLSLSLRPGQVHRAELTQFTFVMALAVGKSVDANKKTLEMDNHPKASFNSPWLVAEMIQKFTELSTSAFSLQWCRVRVGKMLK